MTKVLITLAPTRAVEKLAKQNLEILNGLYSIELSSDEINFWKLKAKEANEFYLSLIMKNVDQELINKWSKEHFCEDFFHETKKYNRALSKLHNIGSHRKVCELINSDDLEDYALLIAHGYIYDMYVNGARYVALTDYGVMHIL